MSRRGAIWKWLGRCLLVRLATLPWYDLPESRRSLDEFWWATKRQLADAGMAGVPRDLNRTLSLGKVWSHPGLLISQCCGPDLFSSEGAGLVAFARPVFADIDCEAGEYFSHIVARKGTLPEVPRLAVNSPTSYSGCHAARGWLAREGLRKYSVTITGSHRQSLAALVSGTADIAAIDAHSFAMMDLTPSLVIIGRSDAAPTPPYVTRVEPGDRALLLGALQIAAQDCGLQIGVSAVVSASSADYEPLLDITD